MLAILSPARNIHPVALECVTPERPLFPKQIMRIIKVLKGYSAWQLESLLDVDPQRAFEFYDLYQNFDMDAPGTAALLSYYGAAFRNLNAQEFNSGAFSFAQSHLRILSALYGLLRPADGILPYRLGIKRDFLIGGKDLYSFWGDRIYKALFQSKEPVVSLTSLDYSKLITPYLKPGDTLINCRFLVQKPGGARGTVSTVRMARGQMARYLVKNRITEPEGLKGFDWEGYRFIESRSDEHNYVFVQEQKDRSIFTFE